MARVLVYLTRLAPILLVIAAAFLMSGIESLYHAFQEALRAAIR
jgi:hypothetical protein